MPKENCVQCDESFWHLFFTVVPINLADEKKKSFQFQKVKNPYFKKFLYLNTVCKHWGKMSLYSVLLLKEKTTI